LSFLILNNLMNKVLLCLIINYLIFYIQGNRIRKSLVESKEILTVNNLNDVYNSNLQQEMVKKKFLKFFF
jgi:hypothetical protein